MINLVENKRSFKGFQKVFKHESTSNKSLMHFAVYEPDISKNCPVLYFLSGLTCTEQNFIQKSGFQQFASNYKIAVVVPDTSPRGKDIADSDDFKLGQGAGFYINATNDVWSKNYNMYDYIVKELTEIIDNNFNFSKTQIGIFGHSMGGGGAIQCAFKNPKYFKSLSAFSPICSLYKSNFAQLALKNYFNNDSNLINSFDPMYLSKDQKHLFDNILIDVGLKDEFINDLFIDEFVKECDKIGQKTNFRKHLDFGHDYYFIQSFIKDHFDFHSNILNFRKGRNDLNS